LQKAARQRGARAWSHEMLLDFLEKRNEARTPSASRADGDETKPTHDIKEWLKEFETLESDPELKEFFDHNRFE
jgi:hypothetical protein